VKSKSAALSKSEETKLQLLKAATTSFAYEGFHATSLKQIALSAGVNQALIAYHFGNKNGLYLAVFESIVNQIRSRVGPRMDALQARTVIKASPESSVTVTAPNILRDELFSIVDAMLELLSSDASREWALLITREQASPTDAFEVIYQGFMGKMLGLTTAVIHLLKPEKSEDEARLFAILLMGQVIVFRVSRTAVLRHMDWQEIGVEELELAKQQLHQNITAWLAK
jgi:AcrR family transcriptional regulator